MITGTEKQKNITREEGGLQGDRRRMNTGERSRKKQQRQKKKARDRLLQTRVLDRIPDSYIDLFPAARAIRRSFVLHIGPTNSGKTHDAVEALKAAGSGCYLGPLRLLAYEKYEKLNRTGYPCSLVTGEERCEVADAPFQASTIEMLNLEKEYRLVIIDEGQMIADRDRGGAWTAAVLGAAAKEIHVCAAPQAEELLIRMITECGDDYRIERHERMTPLICEKKPYRMDRDTEKGDALIVFSRSNVHAVAAELHERGFRASIIYGALPYDVRHEQARLFSEKKTDIVVATDAIGMGMNLPVRRIVFLETDKFDGTSRRPLQDEEIRQIAGRAGRFGIYDEGYVTSETNRSMIHSALAGERQALKEAVIDFPETLLEIDAPLRKILEKWDRLKINEGYVRADTKRMLSLCEMIQDLSDDKHFLYRCLTLNFDEENRPLLLHWKAMCASEARGKAYPVKRYIPPEAMIEKLAGNLEGLEQLFRFLDLLYGYCDRFSHPEYTEELMRKKNRISKAILSILERQKLNPRRCRVCGRKIRWNHPYSICENCYRRQIKRYG